MPQRLQRAVLLHELFVTLARQRDIELLVAVVRAGFVPDGAVAVKRGPQGALVRSQAQVAADLVRADEFLERLLQQIETNSLLC
mgnify:CR=1 FL=1